MVVKDVVECINKAAPYNIACDWDNSGFLIGHEDCEVERVMIALDFTDDVLDEALECGCNLIVTHHPFIFKGLSRITDETAEGALVLKLIESGVSLVCAHTNLDMAVGGINDVLCEKLGLCDVTHLGFAAEDADGNTIGEFRMGTADIMFYDFLDKVKEVLGCEAVKYSDCENFKVNKAAVCSGSGCSLLDKVIESDADVFLTADAKYHDFQNAKNAGVVLVDAGHFETENIICGKIAELLSEAGLDTVQSRRHSGFYKFR